MIVLDTHAFLWWNSEPDRLSPTARAVIGQAPSIGISSLSCWEISRLATRGRIELDREPRAWIRMALAREGIHVAELTPAVAVAAGQLGTEFPGDPVDLMIYATAVALGARLVTKDLRLRAADPERTVW